MMSCNFERLQFLEYYQEKKSSSLNSVRPQGPEKEALPQSSPAMLCSGKLLLTSVSYLFLSHWMSFSPKDF